MELQDEQPGWNSDGFIERVSTEVWTGPIGGEGGSPKKDVFLEPRNVTSFGKIKGGFYCNQGVAFASGT